MIKRTYIGVDLSGDMLTAVAIQRGRPVTKLVGVRREPLPRLIELSSRQANVTVPGRFVEILRGALDPLCGGEERLALSLPDRVGRLYLVEVESSFKSRQEGIDILKWRLKGNLPAPPAQVQLDYQVMERREDGRVRCVVAAIAKPVLEQFEELVVEAGRHAVQIDFHSLNLFSYYRPRLDLGEEFLLIGVERDQLSVIYVSGRALAYQRVRDGEPQADVVFRELTRTLADAVSSHPGMQRCPVFAHIDPNLGGETPAVLQGILEREVRLLDPQLKRFAGGAAIGLPPSGAVLAALGAAERLMTP